MTVDHVIPTARGGDDGPDNLVPACERCNNDKGSLTVEEWERVKRVRRGYPA